MNKLVSAIIAFYVAGFIYAEMPFVKTLTIADKFSASGLFLNHFAIFLIIFIAASFVLQKHVSAYGSNLKIIIASLLLVGLFLTLFYHLIPIAGVYTLPVALSPFFVSSNAFLAWLIAPLVFLFF